MAVKPIYYVVHPLDDEPESKVVVDGLMNLSPGQKMALVALQVYLWMIVALGLYRFLKGVL